MSVLLVPLGPVRGARVVVGEWHTQRAPSLSSVAPDTWSTGTWRSGRRKRGGGSRTVERRSLTLEGSLESWRALGRSRHNVVDANTWIIIHDITAPVSPLWRTAFVIGRGDSMRHTTGIDTIVHDTFVLRATVSLLLPVALHGENLYETNAVDGYQNSKAQRDQECRTYKMLIISSSSPIDSLIGSLVIAPVSAIRAWCKIF